MKIQMVVVALRRAGEFHHSSCKVETAPRCTQESRTTSLVNQSLPKCPPDCLTTCDLWLMSLQLALFPGFHCRSLSSLQVSFQHQNGTTCDGGFGLWDRGRGLHWWCLSATYLGKYYTLVVITHLQKIRYGAQCFCLLLESHTDSLQLFQQFTKCFTLSIPFIIHIHNMTLLTDRSG